MNRPGGQDDRELAEALEADLRALEARDEITGRAKKAARKATREKKQRAGEEKYLGRKSGGAGGGGGGGRASTVPFALGLVALHATNAARIDDGLVGVSLPLHEEDLRLLVQGYWFDYREADRAQRFIETYCRHYEGEWTGRQLRLQVWQRQFIRRLFGWRRPNGRRRYTEVYLQIARKNGKTLLAAAIELYLLVCDGEPGAKVLMAATSEDQARLCYTAAKNMVDGDDELSSERGGRLVVRESYIQDLKTGSVLVPVVGKLGDGTNPSSAVVDEYHEAVHATAYKSIKNGMKTRRQPLLLVITTAGVNIDGPCYTQYQYARKVRDGVVPATHFLPVVYELEEGDDRDDPRNWHKANPNLGVAFTLEKMREDYADQVLNGTPDAKREFYTKQLNIWTQSAAAAFNLERWDRCAQFVEAGGGGGGAGGGGGGSGAKKTKRAAREAGGLWAGGVGVGDEVFEQLRGREVYLGIDAALQGDLCALVAVCPWTREMFERAGKGVRRLLGEYGTAIAADVWCRFYLPEHNIENRIAQEGIDWRAWAANGEVVLTPGEMTDQETIRQDVLRIAEAADLREVRYDPTMIKMLVERLSGEDRIECVAMPNTYAQISEPFRAVQRMVMQRGMRHGGHRTLRYCASNTVVRLYKDMAMPDKDKSRRRGHIDGIPALIMATGGMMMNMAQGVPMAPVAIDGVQ